MLAGRGYRISRDAIKGSQMNGSLLYLFRRYLPYFRDNELRVLYSRPRPPRQRGDDK